jgi:hypothetical protein
MSKFLEDKGYQLLADYIRRHFKGASLRRTMNKGRGPSEGIADAILTYRGKNFHIEIKARSKSLGTNVRFAHQTISKAHRRDLIVALVCHLEDPKSKPSIEFFSLGAVQNSILVEPHFIVQQSSIRGRMSTLADLMRAKQNPLDLSALLKTKVEEHMKVGA